MHYKILHMSSKHGHRKFYGKMADIFFPLFSLLEPNLRLFANWPLALFIEHLHILVEINFTQNKICQTVVFSVRL